MEGEEASLKVESEMVFRFPDRKAAEAAYQSLNEEGNVSRRCRSETKLDGERIKITITADDAVSFRATVNGFLRALQVFEAVEMLTEKS